MPNHKLDQLWQIPLRTLQWMGFKKRQTLVHPGMAQWECADVSPMYYGQSI